MAECCTQSSARRQLPPCAAAAIVVVPYGHRGDVDDNAPLFPSRKGAAPLYPRAVNRMIKAAAARANVNPSVSAHWLRHAHASHALTRGATVAEVKDTLGHANVATTSTYLHAHPDKSSGLMLDPGVFLR